MFYFFFFLFFRKLILEVRKQVWSLANTRKQANSHLQILTHTKHGQRRSSPLHGKGGNLIKPNSQLYFLHSNKKSGYPSAQAFIYIETWRLPTVMSPMGASAAPIWLTAFSANHYTACSIGDSFVPPTAQVSACPDIQQDSLSGILVKEASFPRNGWKENMLFFFTFLSHSVGKRIQLWELWAGGCFLILSIILTEMCLFSSLTLQKSP